MKINARNILLTIVVYSFAWRLVSDISRFSFIMSYLPDMLLIFLLTCFCVSGKNYTMADKNALRFLLIFAGICLTGLAFNKDNISSVILFAWGIRNQFRFLIFYILCLAYLKDVNYAKVKKIVSILLLLDIITISVQFFVLGYRNDFVSGIFGLQQGGNGITNIFISVISVWAITDFLNKVISTRKFGIHIIGCLYIATLAEIKYYFIELALFIGIAVLISGQIKRKIMILAGSILAFLIGVTALSYFYPYFAHFFTLKNLIHYIQKGALGPHIAVEFIHGYSRAYALSGITRDFFSNDIIHLLFGLSLGYTDYFPFTIGQNGFADTYNYLLYYNYHFSMIYIETGLTGLSCFVAMFINSIIQGWKKRKHNKQIAQYSHYLILLGSAGIAIFFYDSSLRTAASGYFYYFILAITFIHMKKTTTPVCEVKK